MEGEEEEEEEEGREVSNKGPRFRAQTATNRRAIETRQQQQQQRQSRERKGKNKQIDPKKMHIYVGVYK